MRKISTLILACLLACACARPALPAAAALAPKPISRAEDLTSKTVALVVNDEEDGSMHAYCTGVWVGERLIVTAAHCVEDAYQSPRYVTKADVYDANGDERKYPHERSSHVMRIDADHDVALLFADEVPAHSIAELATHVDQGDRVFSMGHSKGLLWSYSSGDVAAVRVEAIDTEPMRWVQSTAPISPGNSGGGLFNADGRLVGICSRAYAGRAQNLSFWVHVSYAAEMLK